MSVYRPDRLTKANRRYVEAFYTVAARKQHPTVRDVQAVTGHAGTSSVHHGLWEAHRHGWVERPDGPFAWGPAIPMIPDNDENGVVVIDVPIDNGSLKAGSKVGYSVDDLDAEGPGIWLENPWMQRHLCVTVDPVDRDRAVRLGTGLWVWERPGSSFVELRSAA